MNLVLIMATKNVFINFLRLVCAFFDTIIYTIAAIILRIIFQLANFELTGFYESIENRVYVILGIFMLFKITISLITYLVNPDKINDKEQGMSKVVTRIITVLVMLIMLPSFFSFMTEFQNKLLPVVPRIIVGTANTLNSEDVYYISENMSITMMRAFLRKSSDDCDGSEISALPDILDNVNDACSSDKNKMYRYDYLYGISTIVGIAMCYCLFSMAIQVSIRAIKLIILRMMAPIPVISYIDPKSSKDGAFSHWVKTFMMTWGELFINLGILYFIVYIIEFMLTKDAWRGFFSSTSGNGVLSVWDSTMLLSFLIVGLFFFGKSAPKFIFDALGIKDKGNFVRMLGMGATAVGGIGATRSMLRARNEYDDQNREKGATFPRKAVNLGKSLFSGLGAIGAGGSALLSTDKPTLLTGIDAQSKNNSTALSRISSGSTLGGRLGSIGQTLLTGETKADKIERQIKVMEEFNGALDAIGKRASGEMVKSDVTSGSLGINNYTANYKSFKAAMDAAVATGSNIVNFHDNTSGTTVSISMEDAQKQIGFLMKNNEDSYIREVSAGRIDDAIMTSQINDAQIKATEVGKTGNTSLDASVATFYGSDGKFKVSSRDSIKKTQDAISINTTKLKQENVVNVANRHGQGNGGKK